MNFKEFDMSIDPLSQKGRNMEIGLVISELRNLCDMYDGATPEEKEDILNQIFDRVDALFMETRM